MISEPSARATQLLAFRSAALTLWGTRAWQEVLDRLPADARAALVVDGLVVAVGWVPEWHLVTLAQAVHDGPAQGSDEAYREFVKQVIALGFGRVRRLLVHFAPPGAVIKRAPELWRHDHTHGELAVETRATGTTLHVSHEVITSTPLSRMTCAEMFRAVASLTRARDVRQTHTLERPGTLRVELEWR
jgi:hypothetical protein